MGKSKNKTFKNTYPCVQVCSYEMNMHLYALRQWSGSSANPSVKRQGKIRNAFKKRLKSSLSGRWGVWPAREDPITTSLSCSWPTITVSPWSNGCHLSGWGSARVLQQAGLLAQPDASYLVLLHTHKLIFLSRSLSQTNTGEHKEVSSAMQMSRGNGFKMATGILWQMTCNR